MEPNRIGRANCRSASSFSARLQFEHGVLRSTIGASGNRSPLSLDRRGSLMCHSLSFRSPSDGTKAKMGSLHCCRTARHVGRQSAARGRGPMFGACTLTGAGNSGGQWSASFELKKTDDGFTGTFHWNSEGKDARTESFRGTYDSAKQEIVFHAAERERLITDHAPLPTVG
jgi:hypothetical protein